MKNWKLPALLNTPLGVVIVVSAVALGVELLFMTLLHGFFKVQFKLSDTAWNFIDAAMLVATLSPALYFLVFRKMHESEERFRQINSSAQDAIVIINEQVQVTDWNFAAQKMFQYSREEALGQQLHQLLAPPRYHADTARGFARFQETGAGPLIGKTTEITALRKDGSEVPVELSISAVKVKGRWHAMGVMRDITERKKTEETLRVQRTELEMQNEELQRIRVEQEVSRARYVDLYDLAPLGYCTVASETGLILQANLAVAAMLGVVLGALIKQQISHFILPEDQDIYYLFHKKLFKLGEPQSCEIRMVKNDGTQLWVSLSATATQDEDGVLVARVALSDTTERKRAEELFRAQFDETQRARLEWQAVFDSISQPIFLHDGEFRVTRANRAYAKAAGMDIGDVIGQPYWKAFPRGEGPLASCSQSLHSHNEENEEFRTDGEVYQSRAFLAEYIPGEQCSVHILDNITDRKQTEAVLKFLAESGYKHRDEDFFQALAEFLAQTMRMDYVCIDRLEGDNLSARTLAIYFDGKFEDNVSYTLKDTPCGDVVAKKVCCFSKDVRHLFPQDAVLQEMLAESYVGTTLFDFDGKSIGLIAAIGRKPLANPRLAEVLLQMVAVRAAAELERQKMGGELQEMLKAANQSSQVMLGVVEDQRRAEESLHQLNEELENKVLARTTDLEHARLDAEQANQAKSSFLAAMSHEIRTPMNGVIGMVDVLHQSSLHGYQVEMVDLIRESAYSLLGIINDILDFSKIEAGKLEIEHAPTRVADVVENVCGMLDGMAGKKGVELTLFTDPAIPAEVLGDTLRLRQVLVNIVNNAIKFSGKQQGKVSVRTLLAESTPEQVTLELRVTDNGIGMNEETLSGLFTPFTQADISTTRHFGGTGLGLSIAHHLVELMGGKITVQSEPDKGSTFTVHLTFVPLPSKPDAGAAASPVTGLSCLLIGGTEGLTKDLSSYLTHDGAVVERAADMATAQTLMPTLTSGQWIWIIDAIGVPPPQDELRAVTSAHPKQETRFVIIGRGQRRKPRVQDAGMVSVDGNVLTRRILLKAVAIAAGRASVEQETPQTGKSEAEFKPPSRDDAMRQGRLILVAEDNETNQKVILRQLALLGFAADIADNGRIALERWQSGNYGMLLSDLHMPEMDGYELTAAIRAAEQGSRHIPIVALTANALKGEADHCRVVGMDDYLSKPTQLADLKAMLEKWLPVFEDVGRDLSRHASPDLVVETVGLKPDLQPSAPAPIPVDVNVLKKLVGDDEEIIRDFLHDFRISAAKIAVELRTACVAGQATTAGALAHKLKSSARSVGALVLGELCAEMEQAGKGGDMAALTALLPRFELELASVERFLEGY